MACDRQNCGCLVACAAGLARRPAPPQIPPSCHRQRTRTPPGAWPHPTCEEMGTAIWSCGQRSSRSVSSARGRPPPRPAAERPRARCRRPGQASSAGVAPARYGEAHAPRGPRRCAARRSGRTVGGTRGARRPLVKTSDPVPAAPVATTGAESTSPAVGTRSRKAKTAVDDRGSQRDWRALVEEARDAGIAAVAQLHGVNPKTLRWWKWRLSASETGTSRKRAASVTAEAQSGPAVAKPRRTAATHATADADVEAALRAGLARLILEHGTTRALEVFRVVVERLREAAK